jgi:hypothetical protein
MIIYYLYGLIGLTVLSCATLSIVCSGAMFWFDMSLEDIQSQTNEITKTDEITKTVDNAQLVESFYKKTGFTPLDMVLFKMKWLEKYELVSSYFNLVTDNLIKIFSKLRELTEIMPMFSNVYEYYDYVKELVNELIQSIFAFKQLSKLSRSMTLPSQNNNQPAFDLSALNGLFDNMTDNTSNDGNGLNGLGGFDMSQMSDIEKNMTAEQKKQANDAAMNMLNNFDMSNMMSMFGMPQPNTNPTKSNANSKPRINNKKNKKKVK